MPPRYSTSTSTSYPKGSPARTVVKKSSTSPTFMGMTRSTNLTTVNGSVASRGSTFTSTGGGSAGGMLGPLLIIGGVFMLWVVFRGKSGAMWNAVTGDNSFTANLDAIAKAYPITSSGGGGGGGGGGGNKGSSNAPDSGTHMGIDSNGNIITINKDYGSMSASEKDAANNFAHQIGNVGA